MVADDGSGIRSTLVDDNFLGRSMTPNGFSQNSLEYLLITSGGQQEINRLPRFINYPLQIQPLALEANIGLMQAPAASDRSLMPVNGPIELRTVFDHPSVIHEMIHMDPALFQKFFNMAGAQRIRHISADTHENDLGRERRPFEVHCHHRSPFMQRGFIEDEHTSK